MGDCEQGILPRHQQRVAHRGPKGNRLPEIAVTMTLRVPSWLIPCVLTIVCLVAMYRTYQVKKWWDLSFVLYAAWLIPIFAIWMVYFAILYWLK